MAIRCARCKEVLTYDSTWPAQAYDDYRDWYRLSPDGYCPNPNCRADLKGNLEDF